MTAHEIDAQMEKARSSAAADCALRRKKNNEAMGP